MPCDTRLKVGQTIQQRKEEVRKVLSVVEKLLASRQMKIRISPQGGVAFVGLATNERNDVTDACIYRRIMSTGSALARAEIAKAEQMSGVTVNRKVLAGGHHTHDGGKTWHNGH